MMDLRGAGGDVRKGGVGLHQGETCELQEKGCDSTPQQSASTPPLPGWRVPHFNRVFHTSTGCVRPSTARMAGSELVGRPMDGVDDADDGGAAAPAARPEEKKLQRSSA